MPAAAKVHDIASASIPDALAALRVNPQTGLARAEVAIRRKVDRGGGSEDARPRQRLPADA